jgi:hypothetical protein
MVLMLPTAPAMAPETAAAGAASELRLVMPLTGGFAVDTNVQFGVLAVCGGTIACAIASLLPGTARASIALAATRLPERRPIFAKPIIPNPQKTESTKTRHSEKT